MRENIELVVWDSEHDGVMVGGGWVAAWDLVGDVLGAFDCSVDGHR